MAVFLRLWRSEWELSAQVCGFEPLESGAPLEEVVTEEGLEAYLPAPLPDLSQLHDPHGGPTPQLGTSHHQASPALIDCVLSKVFIPQVISLDVLSQQQEKA